MAKRSPYSVLGRNFGGGYVANASRYACGSVKPHRNAAGQTFTASRGGGQSKGVGSDAGQLRVYGSLDPLRRGFSGLVERGVCPCCGGPGKLRLSAKGRNLLGARRAIVAARAAREAALLRLIADALGVAL